MIRAERDMLIVTSVGCDTIAIPSVSADVIARINLHSRCPLVRLRLVSPSPTETRREREFARPEVLNGDSITPQTLRFLIPSVRSYPSFKKKKKLLTVHLEDVKTPRD